MNFETFGRGLHMAVEAAFRLDCLIEEEVVHEINGATIQDLESALHEARLSQKTGLKTEVAEAYGSGDIERIADVQKIAQEQALVAVQRKAARMAVQNYSQDSRIKENYIKEWNNYGYPL